MPDHEWSWTLDTTLASRQGAHIQCMQGILQRLTELGWGGRDLFGVEISLEETLTNAIRHGNKLDEAKYVFVVCKISPQRFWLRVQDQGEGFDPEEVPDCTADENLKQCGGRGLLLIQAYMTNVTYNKCGNCVTLEKVRSAQPAE